jgi:hypothetical protein
MKPVVSYIGITVLILGCVVGIVIMHLKVSAMRHDVAGRQHQLDLAPQEEVQTIKMKKELVSSQNTFLDLQKMIVSSDGLPDVITAISSAAASSGVTAQVPQVAQDIGKNAQPVGGLPTDTLQNVRMHISASGNPTSLILFLYKIEQLPYLLYIASSTIDTTHQVSLSSFFSVAPTDKAAPPAVQGSSLEADIVITTSK